MSQRKTCGTCGPDGGLCEWADTGVDRSNGILVWCPINETGKDSHDRYERHFQIIKPESWSECRQHESLRTQRERAEKAEARVAELEGALREIIKRMIAVGGMQDGVSPGTTREIIDGIEALKVQP